MPELVEMDARSKKNIDTLQPKAQAKALAWLAACRRRGWTAVIICGTRTFKEQADLYAIGRHKDLRSRPVTNAMAGSSYHNYGLAWDFCCFDGVDSKGGIGNALWDDKHLVPCGKLAVEMGLEWAGEWKSFKETPHIQMPNITLASLRKEMPKGWVV